jgi:hypothetical protein
MPNFLDEDFVKQQESSPSILTFLGHLCLCFVESIGLLLLFTLPLGFFFIHLIEPYFAPFFAQIIGISLLVSCVLFGILVPIHTLFQRGNFIVFKDSLLRMNLISIGLWSFSCFILGSSLSDVSIGLKLLAWLSIGFFLTSLRFKYSVQKIIPLLFLLYWFLSILLCWWYNK